MLSSPLIFSVSFDPVSVIDAISEVDALTTDVAMINAETAMSSMMSSVASMMSSVSSMMSSVLVVVAGHFCSCCFFMYLCILRVGDSSLMLF